MLTRPVVLLGVTVVAAVVGLTILPSVLGLGNLAETADKICTHRFEAFTSAGALLPVAASSIAGILLGSLLFWRPDGGTRGPEAAAQTRFCTNCGRGNDPSWNLCPFCGQSVRPARQDAGEASSEE